MQDFTEVLQRCALFEGIAPDDLNAILQCMKGRAMRFERGEVIFSRESRAEQVGIVLEGSVRIVRDDYYGNRAILGQFSSGELFGEAFACADVERLPVTVEGATAGRALIVRMSRVIETCSNACEFHNRVVSNLLRVMAAKNLRLNRKLQITSQRTIRDKLMAYLLLQAEEAHSDRFTIPFDRQALADYLCVDRSALSAEIGRLRREGVLESERSTFTLLKRIM